MSGALAAMTGMGNAVSIAVTIGTGGGGGAGFASYGSLSIATVKGSTIQTAISSVGVDFSFALAAGSLTKDFLSRFVVETSTGAIRSYLTSDAVFSNSFTPNWQFGSGSSVVWTPADAGSIRRLLIYY